MIASREVEKRVADFVEACRRRGIKATHQRTEILRELAGTAEHPDAETVYARVRRRIPSISLDTVYRTLRMLEEEGVVSRVSHAQTRARFDANTSRHHHFVCSGCGMVQDFYSRALDALTLPPEAALIGAGKSLYVEVRGLCRKCQAERTGEL